MRENAFPPATEPDEDEDTANSDDHIFTAGPLSLELYQQ